MLKSKTKPGKQRGKRRKVELACTLTDFVKEKEGTDVQMESNLQSLSLTDTEAFRDITGELKRPKL